jgi:hypothetical protein
LCPGAAWRPLVFPGKVVGASNKIATVVKATEPIEYLDIETMGFEGGRLRS